MADILKRTNVENKDFDFTADDVNELIDAINLSYNNGGETSIYQWSDNLVYNPYFSIDYEGRNQYDNTKEDGIHILNGYWNGTSGWTNFSRGNRKDFETCIIDNTKMLHFTKVGTEELIIPSGVRPSTDYGMENVRIPVCDYSGDSCNVIKISFDYISPSNKQFVFVCKSVEGNIIKSCKVLKFYTNNIETKYETIYFRDGKYILLPSVATKTKIEIFFEGAKSTTINAPIYNYKQIGIFALRDKKNDDYEQTFADSWYNREFYFGNPCINLLSFTKDKNKNILNKSNEELNYIKNQLNSHINNNLVHLKTDGEGSKLLTDNGSYSDNYYNKEDIDDLISKKSKVESSDKNGYIKIDDNDIVVYQNNGVINTLEEAITYDNYEFYYIFNEKNKDDIMIIDTYYYTNAYQVKVLFDPKEENHFYRIQTTNLNYVCSTHLYYKDNNNIYSLSSLKLDPNSIYYIYIIDKKLYVQKISDGNTDKNFNSHTYGYYMKSNSSDDVIDFKFYKDGILYGDNSIDKTTALSNQKVYLYYNYNLSMREYTIDYFLNHVMTKYGIYCYIVFGNNFSIDNYVEALKKANSNIQSNNFYIHFLFVVNGKCLKERVFYSSDEIIGGSDYVLGSNVFLENSNIEDTGIEDIYTKGSIKSDKLSSTNIKLYDSDTLDESKLMFEIGKTTFNDSTTDIATMLHHKRGYASVIGYQQPEDSSYAYGSYIVFDKYNKLKRTYGDTYTVEFRQPTIFNEDVKFLGTVEGTINSVPTGCYSKTEVNNKFLALSGNTSSTAMSGEIYLGNNIPINGIAKDGTVIPLILIYGKDVFVGGSNNNLYLRSKNNPIAQINGTNQTIYHTGNKPSANDVGANTTLFSGIIGVDKIESTCINKNNCVDSSGVFTIPETGTYLFIGLVKGLNSLFATRNNSSSKITIMDISNYAVGTDECLPFSRALNLNAGSQFTFSDSNGTRSAWTQLNIIKLV